jgi:predicted alpha/beta superfamily hydrolase
VDLGILYTAPMIRRVAVALLSLIVSACGGGGGSPPTTVPSGMGTATSLVIASTQTGMAYEVQVWLPPDYERGETRLPVIYAMDSEYRFQVLSGVLQSTRRTAILVNVGAMGSDRRWIDFTMPGAEACYRFVTLELIPRIESQYRVDAAKRTLSGHSLSGEFVLFALYLEKPEARHFSSFIAGDGSFWYSSGRVYSPYLDEAVRMEQQMHDRDRKLPVAVVLAGDTQGNAVPANNLYQFLAARGYEGLRLRYFQYGLGHVPMDGPSFADALEFIYGPVP